MEYNCCKADILRYAIVLFQSALIDYLSHDMLNLSEFEVYEALMRWVEYKQEERQKELGTVLRVVR